MRPWMRVNLRFESLVVRYLVVVVMAEIVEKP